MATITLEVPNELELELAARLPRLLERTIEQLRLEKELSNDSVHSPDSASPIYMEVLDFLASMPCREQIIKFTVSEQLQDRIEDLLEKNRNGGLTEAEESEMNTFLRVNYLMGMLKARVRGGKNQALNQSAYSR